MPSVTVRQAVRILQEGGLVGMPTETVYGLAGLATNPESARLIYQLKGRPTGHPLIVHLDHYEQVAAPDPRADLLVRAFWPGPLTLVLWRRWENGHPVIPDEVTGGQDTIAVRLPAHPLARALIRAVGPIAAPSANRFGAVSPTTAAHVREAFPDLPVVDGGPCEVGVESTIVDLSNEHPSILRPGGVTAEELERWLGPLGKASDVAAPGTLPSHYAPKTRVVLSTDPEGVVAELSGRGERPGLLRARPVADYARILYAELRRLDQSGYSVIVVEPASDEGLGAAINDRLRRAAASTAAQ